MLKQYSVKTTHILINSFFFCQHHKTHKVTEVVEDVLLFLAFSATFHSYKECKSSKSSKISLLCKEGRGQNYNKTFIANMSKSVSYENIIFFYDSYVIPQYLDEKMASIVEPIDVGLSANWLVCPL